jgi:hypothetical protein
VEGVAVATGVAEDAAKEGAKVVAKEGAKVVAKEDEVKGVAGHTFVWNLGRSSCISPIPTQTLQP